MPARFVPMKQVAEELSLGEAQVYALVRSKDPARGDDRRPRSVAHRRSLGEWIERLYRDTERFIDEHVHRRRTSAPATRPQELT